MAAYSEKEQAGPRVLVTAGCQGDGMCEAVIERLRVQLLEFVI